MCYGNTRFFFGEICISEKLTKYMGEYVNLLEFFHISLITFPVNSESIKVASYIRKNCSNLALFFILFF